MSKGLWGGFAAFVLFSTVILGGAFMPDNYSASVEALVETHTQDTIYLSRASTYGDYFDNDYIPQSFNLSLHQASYQMGLSGGGIGWKRANLGSMSSEDYEDKVMENFESRTGYLLYNYIKKGARNIPCSYSGRYRIDRIPDRDVWRAGDIGQVELKCGGGNTDVVYVLDKTFLSSLQTDYYFTLSKQMKGLVDNVRSELPGEKVPAEADYSVCAEDPDENDIERSAKKKARNKAIDNYGFSSNKLDNLVENYEFADRVNPSYSRIDYLPDYADANIISDVSKGDVCSDYCEDPEIPEDEEVTLPLTEDECAEYNGEWVEEHTYSTTARYTLEQVDIDLGLIYRDEGGKPEILTHKGMESPVFNVEYVHPLE